MFSSEPLLSQSEISAEIDARRAEVDRSLLRENLKLTPTERFQKHRRLSAFVDQLRTAGQTLRANK
jgi:hypothetical protein